MCVCVCVCTHTHTKRMMENKTERIRNIEKKAG